MKPKTPSDHASNHGTVRKPFLNQFWVIRLRGHATGDTPQADSIGGRLMRMGNAVEETTFSMSSEAPAQPSDRRTSTRHMTILRVGTIFLGERRELCLIRNISAGGLMAHVYSVIKPEERIAVEFKTNQKIAGRVTWAQGSNIGIAFDDPIDVTEMLASQSVLENGWRPRLPRVEVDRCASLRIGARTLWVSTCDISQGGIKVELDEEVEVGADCVLTPDRLRPIHGTIRWVRPGMAGIAFNQVIPFQELMGWLRLQG